MLFKCKMCGASLNVEEGMKVVECEYCSTKQTLPNLSNEKKNNMYERATHFRSTGEYDKAMNIYEHILEEDISDAESYWSLVLCKFGVVYVEDPSTHKRIPTINRMSNTSILADKDYKSALEYADVSQKEIYEEEGRVLANIQKGFLDIASKEKPFDVFISYKETDSQGRRTRDSVIAQDLYHQLTEQGFKVFFSRITLEDKLGSAYEPYIYAALQSSKIMVALGTSKENFNATWVKNEWSRFLTLCKDDPKKMLIPAYRDMDPYDLPEEFSHLQGQDMSKLGFMQDLVRGIKKIVAPEKQRTAPPIMSAQSIAQGSVANFIKRAEIFMLNDNWEDALAYINKALDLDPENGELYLMQFLANNKMQSIDEILTVSSTSIFDDDGFRTALHFLKDPKKKHLQALIDEVKQKSIIKGEMSDVERSKSGSLNEFEDRKANAFMIINNKRDTLDTQKNEALNTCKDIKQACFDNINNSGGGIKPGRLAYQVICTVLALAAIVLAVVAFVGKIYVLLVPSILISVWTGFSTAKHTDNILILVLAICSFGILPFIFYMISYGMMIKNKVKRASKLKENKELVVAIKNFEKIKKYDKKMADKSEPYAKYVKAVSHAISCTKMMTKLDEEEKELGQTFDKSYVELVQKYDDLTAELKKKLDEVNQSLIKTISELTGKEISIEDKNVEEDLNETSGNFSVILTDIGKNKIQVIRIVKEIIHKGLKDTKELVESVAPHNSQLLASNVSRSYAETCVIKLEGVGAKAYFE